MPQALVGTEPREASYFLVYDMNSTLFDPNRDIDLAQNSMEISIQYSFSKNANARRASNPLF